MIVSFLAASGAPTPLYGTYAKEWNYSPITTTMVFAVYAIAVLVALLVLGRLSDHVGRKPVLLAALGLQLVATLVLCTAGAVGWLFLGRTVQGIATGGAIGALGATMLDVSPRWGTKANASAPGLGTSVGALVSALLVQYAPAPTHLIYIVLAVVFALQVVGVVRMPETITREPGAARSMVPELGLPAGLRAPVLAATPIMFAVWALAGLYGSLGPAVLRHVSGSSSVVLGGVAFAVLTAVTAVTASALDGVAPGTVMYVGAVMTIVSAVGALVAVQESSVSGFFAVSVLAGIGFGAGFQGGIRTVVPLTAPHQRSAVLSVLYVACYLGMGLPTVIAGVLVVRGPGLVDTVRLFELFVLLSAVVTMAVRVLTSWPAPSRRTARRERRAARPGAWPAAR